MSSDNDESRQRRDRAMDAYLASQDAQGPPEVKPQAAPGWYPDPHSPQTQRYWDGGGWTGHVSKVPTQSPSKPPFGRPKTAFILLTLGAAVVWGFLYLEGQGEQQRACEVNRGAYEQLTGAPSDRDC